jgi:hypothetical protein
MTIPPVELLALAVDVAAPVPPMPPMPPTLLLAPPMPPTLLLAPLIPPMPPLLPTPVVIDDDGIPPMPPAPVVLAAAVIPLVIAAPPAPVEPALLLPSDLTTTLSEHDVRPIAASRDIRKAPSDVSRFMELIPRPDRSRRA